MYANVIPDHNSLLIWKREYCWWPALRIVRVNYFFQYIQWQEKLRKFCAACPAWSYDYQLLYFIASHSSFLSSFVFPHESFHITAAASTVVNSAYTECKKHQGQRWVPLSLSSSCTNEFHLSPLIQRLFHPRQESFPSTMWRMRSVMRKKKITAGMVDLIEHSNWMFSWILKIIFVLYLCE